MDIADLFKRLKDTVDYESIESTDQEVVNECIQKIVSMRDTRRFITEELKLPIPQMGFAP